MLKGIEFSRGDHFRRPKPVLKGLGRFFYGKSNKIKIKS